MNKYYTTRSINRPWNIGDTRMIIYCNNNLEETKMKKFYIHNETTAENNAVYFDFGNSKFADILDITYIMETGGNPITDNEDDALTLDDLKNQAISEIMGTGEDDEEYITGLCEAWGL